MKRKIYSLLQYVLIIVVTIFVFRYATLPVLIDGHSMDNTLQDQSVALMGAMSIKKGNIQRFDIVVIDCQSLNEKIIKRVIGLPNEHIEYKNDVLYVNGKKVEEDFLDKNFVDQSKSSYRLACFTENFVADVKEGEYLVLGDNRPKSMDSRQLGCFTLKDIIGLKGVVIFPFSQIKVL